MSSAYIAIPVLKNSLISENYLRIFLSHISEAALKEYLSKANIYNGTRNMSKNDLIDMIILDKHKSKICTSDDEDLTQEEINDIPNLIKSEEMLFNTNGEKKYEDCLQLLEKIPYDQN